MSNVIEVKVPDIGDFKDIPVIEVLVKPGDSVEKEDSLITLESDKATMEVPAPEAGVVKELKVKVGDKVSQGTLILTAGSRRAAVAAPKAEARRPGARRQPQPPAVGAAPAAALSASPRPPLGAAGDFHAEVMVLGSGPGGYTAAFRAADLGKKVVLIERYAMLGGVCLNVGCIPSKALLHAARVIAEAEEMSHFGCGVRQAPQIDLDKLRGWKESVVGKSDQGSVGSGQAAQGAGGGRRGEVHRAAHGRGGNRRGQEDRFLRPRIIAAGSQAARIPGFPVRRPAADGFHRRARARDIPKRMLVIGGGIIGLEMATRLRRARLQDHRGRAARRPDSRAPTATSSGRCTSASRSATKAIYLKTKVTRIEALQEGLRATFEGERAPAPQVYDRVLLSVGRRPNGKAIDAEAAGVQVNERGYIPVDKQMRTNVPHIYAIGDIVGEPMLAHKATHEGKLAAEVIAGHKVAFDARTIPSVAYTDPEVAWMGLTETMAKAQGIEIEKAVFPWAASGRALATARDEGMTKLLFDKNTQRLLGAAMVGPNAGELIAETVLALEMGADAAGHRPHHPPASDPVGNGVLRGRDRRRQHHRSVHAEER